MYLDHPVITATHSNTEPDRLERLNRVYGYAVGIADQNGNKKFITKLAQLHDDRGTLIVFWATPPTEAEKGYMTEAWASLIGDGTQNVAHEMQQAPA
jgi:hypothetical protein